MTSGLMSLEAYERQTTGDKANLLGATVEESGLPRVRSGGSTGVPTDALIKPAQSGTGGTGRVTPPPPPPRGGPP